MEKSCVFGDAEAVSFHFRRIQCGKDSVDCLWNGEISRGGHFLTLKAQRFTAGQCCISASSAGGLSTVTPHPIQFCRWEKYEGLVCDEVVNSKVHMGDPFQLSHEQIFSPIAGDLSLCI